MTPKVKLHSIKTAIPGPESRKIYDEEQKYVASGRQRVSQLAGIALDHGEGATLTDADGNTYIDLYAGIAVASLGHGHPRMAKVIGKQIERLSVGTFATRERSEAFKLLSEVAPKGLNRSHLYSGGAEAVEAGWRRVEEGLWTTAWRTLPGALRGLLSLPIQVDAPLVWSAVRRVCARPNQEFLGWRSRGRAGRADAGDCRQRNPAG